MSYIYPTGSLVAFYTYNSAANAITVTSPPGYNTWVTNNTIAHVPYDTPKEIPKMSHPTDTIIESLFKLNPTVRKKYKGDAQKFADALIAAAKQIDGQKALSDLTDLGLTE